jgi:hypothetical protein
VVEGDLAMSLWKQEAEGVDFDAHLSLDDVYAYRLGTSHVHVTKFEPDFGARGVAIPFEPLSGIMTSEHSALIDIFEEAAMWAEQGDWDWTEYGVTMHNFCGQLYVTYEEYLRSGDG